MYFSNLLICCYASSYLSKIIKKLSDINKMLKFHDEFNNKNEPYCDMNQEDEKKISNVEIYNSNNILFRRSFLFIIYNIYFLYI